MPSRSARGSAPEEISPVLIERLLRSGEGQLELDARLRLAAEIRASLGAAARELDRVLLARLDRQAASLHEVQRLQAEILSSLARLNETPWHPAVFRRLVDTPHGPRALVASQGASRVVAIAEQVPCDALRVGDEVFLDGDLRVVVASSGEPLREGADVCTVEERLSEERVLAQWRGEPLLIELSHALRPCALGAGDRLRWHPGLGIAFERLAPTPRGDLFVEVPPELDPTRVGGQDQNLALLVGALSAALLYPGEAARYGLTGKLSVLMVGPPGNGKTLMARVAAAELRRLTGQACRFAVVKPAAWEAAYVGQTELHIRQTFAALKEAARDGLAILFLDEVEAIGRVRGQPMSFHQDRFLASLLAELDGFEDRSRIAVIAATNRKELLDPALLARLSDIELRVGRPDRSAARRILEIHLPAGLDYAGRDGLREEAIETTLSRLFAPNGHAALATIVLRHGERRTLRAAELLSGRTLEQICRGARRTALLRRVRGGAQGITVADLEEATVAALRQLAGALSPSSCRAHLDDLPPDVDVVAVEPLLPRVPLPRRYIDAA